MHGDIEHLASVLRIFRDGDEYGDRYVWCCTVKWISFTEVELCGVVRRVTPEIWGAIMDCFRSSPVLKIVVNVDGNRHVLKVGDAFRDLGSVTRRI